MVIKLNKDFNNFLKSSAYIELVKNYTDDIKKIKGSNSEDALADLLTFNAIYSTNLLRAYHEWLFEEVCPEDVL